MKKAFVFTSTKRDVKHFCILLSEVFLSSFFSTCFVKPTPTLKKASQYLRYGGFASNYFGNSFSAVLGDLVAEYFTRKSKMTASRFRQG